MRIRYAAILTLPDCKLPPILTSGKRLHSTGGSAKSVLLGLWTKAILLVLSSSVSLLAQTSRIQSSYVGDSIITNRSLGISFLNVDRTATKVTDGYRLSLNSTKGFIRKATAEVTASARPFVDLPGSFGGRLYLDDPNVGRFLNNRLKVDTIFIDGLPFQREYWAVYAGMGTWEGVINCYALRHQQYFTLALCIDVMLGKPGEIGGDGRMSLESLRTRLMDVLTDNHEPMIQKFSYFISSFRVTE